MKFVSAFSLISVLMLISTAYADKFPPNLKDLNASDICGNYFDAQVTIDGITDYDEMIILSRLLNDQNILSGKPFSSNHCRIFLWFTSESNSAGSGSYNYFDRIRLYALFGSVELEGRNTSVKAMNIYDINYFGRVDNKTDLIKIMTADAKSSFQEFLLDWRKTH